jgi:hypothetical protein
VGREKTVLRDDQGRRGRHPPGAPPRRAAAGAEPAAAQGGAAGHPDALAPRVRGRHRRQPAGRSPVNNRQFVLQYI